MLRVEALPGGMALGRAAEQRDSYGVTEPRACHAAGISPGQRRQRDPYGVTEPRVRHAVGISEARRAERPFQGDRVYVPP